MYNIFKGEDSKHTPDFCILVPIIIYRYLLMAGKDSCKDVWKVRRCRRLEKRKKCGRSTVRRNCRNTCGHCTGTL